MSKKSKEKREKHRTSSGMAKWREKSSGDFSTLFKLPEGMKMYNIKSADTYFLDVIPYITKEGNEFAKAGKYWWVRSFWVHRGIGVNDEWVVCLAKTFRKPCPCCEFRAKLQDDPEVDEKTVEALKPSNRLIFNMRDLKKDKNTVQLLHMPDWYFGKALRQVLDAEFEDHENNMDEFFLPEGGSYMKCRAEAAEGGFSGYNVVRIDFKARKEDLDDDILEQAANLDDILIVKEYDELKEMLYAAPADKDDDDDDDDDDDAEEPKKKKRKKTSKKKKKDDDDDDDDIDDVTDDDIIDDDVTDDDDEDEDDEPVKKKTKKKTSKKSKPKDDDDDDDDDDDEDWGPDDDDEDEDDDDDDDDDEPIKKKTKKKKRK